MKPAFFLLASTLLVVPVSSGAQSVQQNVHVDTDAVATYGLGNGHTFGVQVHVMTSFNLWRTSRALGALTVGLQGGYQNEPLALQPWADPSTTSGTTHRIPFALTLGHSFLFGRDDRMSFGVHLYAGAVEWISSYRLNWPSVGVDQSHTATALVPDVGAFLRWSWRPHPNVGWVVQAGAPFFRVSPETVVGLFTVATGLTFRFR